MREFELNSWSCLCALRHACCGSLLQLPLEQGGGRRHAHPFGADKPEPAVDRRYRHTVLTNGGQLTPGTLVRRFLGRGSNAKAFFEEQER